MNYNAKKFINNTGWMIGGRIFQMVLSFVITMITARYLGPSNYGIINYVASFCALFTPLCTLGLNDIIVKELVDMPEREGETVGTMIGLRLLSSLLAVFSVIILVSILNNGSRLYIVIALLQSVSLVFNSFETITYWYQYRLESKKTTIITSIAFFVMSAYKVAILIMQKDVRWFAATSSIDIVLIAVMVFGSYKNDNGQTMSFSWTRAKTMFSKSNAFIISGLMVALYGQMDKLMLKEMMGETEVGYYAAAMTLCGTWPFILNAIVDSARPILMDLHNTDRELYVVRTKQLYAAIIWTGIFMGAVITIFAPILVRVVYGNEFINAVHPLRIIAWCSCFAFLGVSRQIWTLSEGLQRYEKDLAFCGTSFNLALNLCLIKEMGATGAAIASLLAQVLTNYLLPFFIKDLRYNSVLITESFLLKGINIKEVIMLIKKSIKKENNIGTVPD